MIEELHVGIWGKTSVGKTSCAHQFFYYTLAPQYEDALRRSIIVDQVLCVVTALDIDEPGEYIAMTHQALRSAQCFLLLYSITDRDSFEEIDRLWEEILRVRDVDDDGQVSVLLVGNKLDLNSERVISTQEGKEYAKERKMGFMECSALTTENIDQVFFELVRRYRTKNTQAHSIKSDKCTFM